MDDDNLKRRVMFGVIGFCGAMMVLTVGCVVVRSSSLDGMMGCLDFLILLGVACAASGVAVAAAMMTES